MKTKNAFLFFVKRPWVIAIFALTLVAIILLVGNQSFKATEAAYLKEFNRRQLVMAREATGGIELYFGFLASALRSIGQNHDVFDPQKTTARQHLIRELNELELMGITDIGVLDASGRIHCTAAAPQLEGVDFSWRRYFQEAKLMTSADSYILEFIEFKGVDVGKKGILVAVPIFDPKATNGGSAGKFGGVVVCTLNLKAITKRFITPITYADRGHAFLLENGHTVLWAPDKSLLGANLIEEAAQFPSFIHLVRRMKAGLTDTGEFTYFEFDRSEGSFSKAAEEKLVAFLPVRLGEEIWTFAVWAPKETARKLIRSSYTKQLSLVGLIILATVVGSCFTIAMVQRYNRHLEMAVAEKTQEFKDSHQRLLTVFDSLDTWVYVADLETFEILFINKYMRELFGDVVGRKCWQVLHEGLNGPCNSCPHSGGLRDGDHLPGSLHIREFKNTLTDKWYETRDRVIQWIDGRTVRLEIAYDITDRKLVENELRRTHHEMGTFCSIIKGIGVQQTLEGIGSFLMKELGTILEKHDMLLFVFSDDHEILFTLSERGTTAIKDQKLIHETAATLAGLNGITVAPQKIFASPLLPEHVNALERQTIVPFTTLSQAAGALVIACEDDCQCEEKELELVSLILDQASGAIRRAVLHEEEIRTLQGRIKSSAAFSGIIGKDPKMQVIYKLIEDIAPTDATVLIQGESGTGKELVAGAIHRKSARRDKPFIVINCSAYPTTLLESELFGHEKGAFTGASRQKIGRFEQAHQDTVFLDEIGEISASAQIKLLRVLQTQKFERLGGEQTLAVDIRILAATNKSLLQEVKAGRFREDLFYRLHVIPINLPPLRERRNDIPLLARHFQRQFMLPGNGARQDFSSETMRCLLDYTWPGNVRELENSIEHAVLLSKGGRIEVSHLPSGLCEANPLSSANSQRSILENEKKLLLEVLKECNWNKSQAALRLGISRSTLYDKIKKYRISKSAPI